MSEASPFAAPMERIRDAAKWLIAAAAAVGAVLIAGSQLSGIGSLAVGPRLVTAVFGVVLALLAVVAAIWSAVGILLPVGVTIEELERLWPADGRATSTVRADVRFFLDNPDKLGADHRTPGALLAAKSAAWDVRDALQQQVNAADPQTRPDLERRRDEAHAAYLRRYEDVARVQETAQYQLLLERFRRVLRKLLGAAVAGAVGIMLYAWAANPAAGPAVPTSLTGAVLRDADLRDADLTGVDLRDADLTGADLTGADLTGARLDGVRWAGTTCPDGTASDANGGTCRGHRTP